MISDLARRRGFLSSPSLTAVAGCVLPQYALAEEPTPDAEVGANDDLMREHGIIRRALLVYREAARRARHAPKTLPLAQLAETATLFRRFAEDYHERALEEAHVFPLVRKASRTIAKLPDILLAQHARGREITDFVKRESARPTLCAHADTVAAVLEGFMSMYEPHAAREDTELFPAWKAALGPKAYAEMGEQFEDIEHTTFGGDGFDEALRQISRIEAVFGIADLAAATAPSPPSDAGH